jgi:hypothetical protein
MIYPHVKYLGPAYPERRDAATVRELLSRIDDGIRVRLLWCEGDCRLQVSVTDTKTGVAFSVPVRDSDRALDVFHHPYA